MMLTVEIAEEARKTLKGMTLQQLHSKYVDLVSIRFLLACIFPTDSCSEVSGLSTAGERPCKGETEEQEGSGCMYVYSWIYAEWRVLLCLPAKTALTNVQKLKAKTDAVVRDMQKVCTKYALLLATDQAFVQQNKDLRVCFFLKPSNDPLIPI